MRNLFEIAAEIRRDWKSPSPYAVPYITAMMQLSSVDDTYYADDADDIVRRFLCNASGWKGDTARRIKNELKNMIGA